jgi:O-antigen ligase
MIDILKTSTIFSIIASLFVISVSLFIAYGDQWVGKLNYLIVFLVIIGCWTLLMTRANDQLLIVALIFFLTFNADYPLIYHPQVAGGTRPTPEIWLVDIILFILIFKYIIKVRYAAEDDIVLDKKFKMLLIAFIVWEAMTLFNAIDYQSVLFQLVKDLRYFSIFAFLLLFINNDAQKLHFVIIALFCTIAFQNSWAVIQFINQSTFGLSVLGETPIKGVNLDLLERYTGESFTIFGLKFGKYVSGFAGSSYLLARENLLLLPLFLSMYLSDRYIFNRTVHIAGMILMISGLLFGLSKSAWVSAAIAVMVVYIFEVMHKRLSIKKFLFLIISFVFLFVAFGKLLYLRIFETNLSQSFGSRNLLVEFGIERFVEHPLMGVGANNIWLYFNKLWGNQTTVHNLYILLLSEIGIIGLLIFLIVMLLILLKTISIDKSDQYLYAISVGLTGSFIGFYWDSLWTWLYRFNPVGCLFWAICAVSFAAYNISNSDLKKQTAHISTIQGKSKEQLAALP